MEKRFGVELSASGAIPKGLMDKLAELNVTTAEEFLAMAAVEGVKDLLAKFLGLTAKNLDAQLEQVRKTMPARAVLAMQEPYAELLTLGAMEPPPQMLAMVTGPYECTTSPASLPTNVNHISRMNPIRNQASRGTCVGFACTALDEFYAKVVRSTDVNLSEQCLYKRCKEIDQHPNVEGTWVRFAMGILEQTGQATETCEPYNPNPPTNQPGPHPACCIAESPSWKIFKSLQLNQNSVNDIKAALADEKVVAFSVPVYNSWYQSAAVRRTGNITMPLPGESNVGGHAMTFVGYQDDAATPGGGYFILRNSWGTSAFGSACTYGAGYGTLPYQYMTNHGWEAFTFQRPPAPVCPRPLNICPLPKICPRPIVPPPCPPVAKLPCPPAPKPFCPPVAKIPCPPAPRPLCPPVAKLTCPPVAKELICPPAPKPDFCSAGPYYREFDWEIWERYLISQGWTPPPQAPQAAYGEEELNQALVDAYNQGYCDAIQTAEAQAAAECGCGATFEEGTYDPTLRRR